MRKSLAWKAAAAALITGGTLAVVNWLIAATAFTPADAPTGYIAQLEVTNFNLSSGNEYAFKADYEKQYYSGNLLMYPVGSDGAINYAGEVFDGGARAHLDTQNYDTGRNIATMNGSGTGVPFRWTSSPSSTTMSSSQLSAVGSSDILNFVRGDRSNESVGLGYRSRTNGVLGDIMHSRPFYLANGGTPVVFVGANDGMLHAFDANPHTGGNELWAYVPSMLLSKLNLLTASPYVHNYYVDGGLNVADVTISGATKKILVSGLGGGGQGLFALDITTPTAADEAAVSAKALWEITPSTINNSSSSSYSNLGYTYGLPLITKVNSGSGQSAVIIGNGYNASGASTLYVINAGTGALIKAITTSGSSGGGLSTPACYDSNSDGLVDYCYAGDIDGKLWKFDLSSTSTSSWTATLLYTTSPAQAITMAPSLSVHPNGGVMVNFGTGKMFLASDATDSTTVYYAYGIWDGAPAANAAILTQTLTERSYTLGSVTTRVRNVTSNAATWTSGASNHKGWKVALPAGERIIGDTVFTENGRFYFNSTNPTIDNSALTPVTPNGENWLMELDYLTGGVTNSPFLDLNGDQLLTNSDRIVYTAADVKPAGKATGDPILTTDGIPVGKMHANGVASHPLLVQLATLNTTLMSQNPDTTLPVTGERGVAGGHFDVDIWYASGSPALICSYSGNSSATQPSATISVATTGVSQPASVGAITVTKGSTTITIMNALTSADITDGTATSTNAQTIVNKINALTGTTGFSATRSSSTVTIKAPSGTTWNTATIAIANGTTSSATPASGNPTGTFNITNATARNKGITKIQCNGTDVINQNSATTGSSTLSNNYQYVNALRTSLGSNDTNSYTISCTSASGSGSTVNSPGSVCTVTGPTGAAACSNLSISKDSQISLSTSSPAFSGGTAAVPGVSDLKPKLTVSGSFSGGTDFTIGSFSSCAKNTHFHEYDDIFNVTGVNMLNASSTTLNVSRAFGSSTTFKVLVHNQYMNPAVTLSVGGDAHTSVKTWNNQATETVAANVIANAPTYTSANVQTLEWNMPLDAFAQKDWWGNGDTRVGLMPTTPSCVWDSSSSTGGNLFYPVNPPAAGTDGPGTTGYGTYTGVRHNGALTIQLVRDTIPSTSIELNVSGRPEFGWRVKRADFETYVLAEWSTYWHHPNGKCFQNTGWTKLAPPDTDPTDPSVYQTPASGSDDPATGSFRATTQIISVATTVSGNVTTTVTTYAGGSKQTVVKTANSDGTTTIVTTYPDGTTSTQTISKLEGSITSGGDEKGSQAKTGRVSWSERLRN